MEVMCLREDRRQLTGRVEIEDAYLARERDRADLEARPLAGAGRRCGSWPIRAWWKRGCRASLGFGSYRAGAQAAPP